MGNFINWVSLKEATPDERAAHPWRSGEFAKAFNTPSHLDSRWGGTNEPLLFFKWLNHKFSQKQVSQQEIAGLYAALQNTKFGHDLISRFNQEYSDYQSHGSDYISRYGGQ